ncbi:MAG: DUF3883 domain-containing protein [Bacteroidota bacterium]
MIAFYPGSFFTYFIAVMLEDTADFLTYKYFRITKAKYKDFESKDYLRTRAIKDIEFKIKKDRHWEETRKDPIIVKKEPYQSTQKETTKEVPKPAIKQTEATKTTMPSAQVTKLKETPKPAATPVQQTKPAEPPKQKTQQEIELEEKKDESLFRQLQLLAILAEARLKQRLYDFSLMLMTKQCPPKAQDYIYRLLKEEINGLKERDCYIHNRSYYVEKFGEIEALIGIKPVSEPVISVTPIKETVYEAKSVAETFKDFKPRNTKIEGEEKLIRITPKQDFEALNKHKHDVGYLGEEYIFEWEKQKLKDANREDLIPHVEWVSKDSDSWGYDIRSYTENGELMFIEVKTTTSGKGSTFYLSETELNQMNTLENYYIYRVHDFSIEEKKGHIFPVSKHELPIHFNLEPLSYKVKPK